MNLPLTVQKLIIEYSWFNRSVDYSVYFRKDRLELALVNWDWFHHCSALYNLNGGNITPSQCGFGYETPHCLNSNSYGVFRDTLPRDKTSFNPFLDNPKQLLQHIQSKYCLLKSIHCLNLESPRELNNFHIQAPPIINNNYQKKKNKKKTVEDNNNNNQVVVLRGFGLIRELLYLLKEVDSSGIELVKSITSIVIKENLSIMDPYGNSNELMLELIEMIVNLKLKNSGQLGWRSIHTIYLNNTTLLEPLVPLLQTIDSFTIPVFFEYAPNRLQIPIHFSILLNKMEINDYVKLKHFTIIDRKHPQLSNLDYPNLFMLPASMTTPETTTEPKTTIIYRKTLESMEIDGFYLTQLDNEAFNNRFPNLKSINIFHKTVDVNSSVILQDRFCEFIQNSTTLRDLSMQVIHVSHAIMKRVQLMVSTKQLIKRWNLYLDFSVLGYLKLDLHTDIESLELEEGLPNTGDMVVGTPENILSSYSNWYHLTDLKISIKNQREVAFWEAITSLVNHPNSRLKRLFITVMFLDPFNINKEKDGKWNEFTTSIKNSKTLLLCKITAPQIYPYIDPNPHLPKSTDFPPDIDYNIELKSRDTLYVIRK